MRQRVLGVQPLGILSFLAQTAALGMQLSRGLGAPNLEPEGNWGSWWEGDWEPHGKLQGAEGRPQHWSHHTEELGQGRLLWAQGPALDLTHEHPPPVWSHRDHLVHLGRQKNQGGLRISISGLAPSPLGLYSPPLP